MYDSYKPLRNYLRRFSRQSALTTLYRYVQFLQFETPLPRALDHFMLRRTRKLDIGFFEWELETLVREVVLNCPARGAEFGSWTAFSKAINHLRHAENGAWRSGRRGNDIFFELLRIAHRQFHWQQGFDQDILVRYFRLYDHPAVAPLVERAFSMQPVELFQIGMALSGHFLSTIDMLVPVTNHLNSVPTEVVNRFITRFAVPIEELVTITRAAQSYDVNWAYTFNPLWAHPLVRLSPTEIIAPVPTLLLHRITNGIYFDLVGDPAFANALGPSFQQHVGDAVREGNWCERLRCLPEARYGTRAAPRDSVDWIIEDETATLFVECKASRMRLAGKIDLAGRDAMEAEIARLASFIVQAYVTLAHALNGEYPHWEPTGRPIYPLIVTLDEWHAFGEAADRIIEAQVRDRFAERGLDVALLDAHPYQVCSIQDFEMLVQVLAQRGIAAFMAHKTGEARRWPFHNVMIEDIRQHDLMLQSTFQADLARLDP